MSDNGQGPSTGMRDLKHFLMLASLRLKGRLKEAEASEPYSSRIGKMRMLEELIKEQIPHENSGSSAGSSR